MALVESRSHGSAAHWKLIVTLRGWGTWTELGSWTQSPPIVTQPREFVRRKENVAAVSVWSFPVEAQSALTAEWKLLIPRTFETLHSFCSETSVSRCSVTITSISSLFKIFWKIQFKPKKPFNRCLSKEITLFNDFLNICRMTRVHKSRDGSSSYLKAILVPCKQYLHLYEPLRLT